MLKQPLQTLSLITLNVFVAVSVNLLLNPEIKTTGSSHDQASQLSPEPIPIKN